MPAMSAAPADSASPPPISDTQRRLALVRSEIGSWFWDFARNHFSLDARWCALVGVDPCAGNDHLERWARNIHPDDVFEFHRVLQEVRSGESDRFECEYRILTADSRWLWVLHRGHALEHGVDGKGLRVCGICIEIDVRKQAEVALQENEARLATALWGARAAFWQWQIGANSILMSPLWFAMTGYTRDQWEAASDPWFSRIHPDDREAVEQHMRAHLGAQQSAIDVEYRIRTGNGRWKWMLTRGRAVAWDFDGNATTAIGISLDINARKEAELQFTRNREQLLQTAAASSADWLVLRKRLEREIIEIANREQQRIASDLHDGLGQELTGIALMLRGLAVQLQKQNPALKGEVDDVIGLVNNAIQSSRSLARGLSPVNARRGGLSAALQTLAAQAEERYGIRVTFRGECDGESLRLDENAATHLYRIAQEALTNAARHSGATELTMRIGKTTACAGLQLAIDDNGRGFVQQAADASDGLGLKIMRYRAQMLGGDLVLESSSGGGTSVRCVLPPP